MASNLSQVAMVEECFLKLDSAFEKSDYSTDGVAVYKKRGEISNEG